MLSAEDNDLVTRVCGDAPLGTMLRTHCWIPATISPNLVAGGGPIKVRLLGRDYVAFRGVDGSVGFLDERCPHRGISLTLAHNEDNALRCIFHGWKFSVDGRCVEVPTQPTNHEGFCRGVRVNHYPVQEGGGIVWVFLGSGTPPPFHEFEFVQLPSPSHVVTTVQVVACNWLQLVETAMDSAHLGILHRSAIAKLGQIGIVTDYLAPVYETEHTQYGFRYAAIRETGDGQAYVRVNSFVAPWFSFIAPNDSDTPGATLQLIVPVDDEHSLFFFCEYRRDGVDVERTPIFAGLRNWGDFPPLPPGGPNDRWGQDREAMQHGHWTGFEQSLLTEDLVVALAATPIADRTKEQLNAGDAAIVNVRRAILSALQEYKNGETPACLRRSEFEERGIAPQSGLIPNAADWRQMFAGTLIG